MAGAGAGISLLWAPEPRARYLLADVLVISLLWHTTIASTLPRRSAPLSRGGARVRRAYSGFSGGLACLLRCHLRGLACLLRCHLRTKRQHTPRAILLLLTRQETPAIDVQSSHVCCPFAAGSHGALDDPCTALSPAHAGRPHDERALDRGGYRCAAAHPGPGLRGPPLTKPLRSETCSRD